LPGSINTGFTSLRLPLEQLEEVRNSLSNISNNAVEVWIEESVASLRRVEPPHNFQIRYVWSDEDRAVLRRMSHECENLRNGWFVAGNLYWRVPAILAGDDAWLMRERLESGEAIRLLATEVADCWKKRAAPIVVALKLSAEPAVQVTVREVTAEEAIIETRWRVPPEQTREFPPFPKHVICGETVRPGIVADSLPEFLRRTVALRLRGQALASFSSRVWPMISEWAGGKTEPFHELHKIVGQDIELLLNIRRMEVSGIGRVTAVPRVRVGKMQIDAEPLSRRLSSSEPYLRTPDGWLPIPALKQVHLGFLGRFDDGSPITGFDLTPLEILTRVSTRFRGPWTRIVFPPIQLPDRGPIPDVGQKHLEFLRTWGIPGGVIGPLEQVGTAVQQFLLSLLTAYADSRVLVIGSRRGLDASGLDSQAKARYDGVRADPPFSAHTHGMILATPRALESSPGLLHMNWTLVCLLEADTLIKSAGSTLFSNLLSCQRSMVIGQFAGKDYLRRSAVRDAMGKVFGIDSPLIWNYSLRDPLLAPPRLDEESLVKTPEPSGDVQPAEFAIGSSDAEAGIPIPARQGLTAAPSGASPPRPPVHLSDLGIQVHVRFSSGYDSFVEQARKLVTYSEPQAASVPFMCYWPTYDSMTAAQRRWYFFWREQVRNGQFPSTDLSYIFVHVYELINGVGWHDTRDGYERLHRLWTAYREPHPKLDNYLIDWMSDFLVINPCGIDPLEPIRQAMSLGSRHLDPDTLLSEHIGKPLDEVPLSLWESLSNYRITGSKFYLSGNKDLLESYCPKGMGQIDRFISAKSGGGILQVFKPRILARPNRTAFQSAVYAGSSTTVNLPAVLPYSRHSPLRDFVTSALKHTENRLREVRGFKGKLRGYQLDANIQTVIDEFIERSRTAISPPPPIQRVEIDFARVDQLTRQSDDIRSLLQKPAEEPATIVPTAIPDTKIQNLPSWVVRPEGTPGHLLTDLPGIYWLLKNLDVTESNLVASLVKNDFTRCDRDLQAEFIGIMLEPLVDRINQLAIEFAGDVLIVNAEGSKLIVDDFHDELAHLAQHGMFSQAETRTEPSTGGLPEEWAELGLQLTEVHWLALRSISSSEDVKGSLTQLAREHGTMPETLVDEINDQALSAIGDVIIAPGSDPPTIEDEDTEMVRRLLIQNEDMKCRK